MDGDVRTTIVGFVGAAIVLVALFWFLGIDDIAQTLSGARVPFLVGVVILAGLWLTFWSMSLHTVLGALGSPISAPSAVLVFSASTFSNAVTPFGQAGGEPIAALLIAEAADSEYETGLAAIASVDTLHFVPSIGLATVGLGSIFVRSVALTRNVYLAGFAVALLAATFLSGAILGWYYRFEIERVVVRLFSPVVQGLFSVLPRLEAPTKADIEHSIESFFAAIDRIAGNRRTLLLASLYSTAGWLSLSLGLWVSMAAIGYQIPFVAALVVIPVGSIAAITPLPGGLGGVEAAFIALLVSTAGVTGHVAGAGIVIYRLATYWLPLVVGGGTAAMLGERRRQSR